MVGTLQNSTVDTLLTDASNAIMPQGFIADSILPTIRVGNQGGKLLGYGNSHLRIEQSIHIGKNKVSQVDTRTYTTSSYYIEDHALKDIITATDFKNAINPQNPRDEVTIMLKTMLMLGREKAIADSLGSTSVLTQNTTLSGTSQYNDYTNSDPIGDFDTARSTIYGSVGTPPDTAIMSWEVFNTLRNHSGLMDYLGFKYNRPGGLVEAEVASVLGVQKLLIGTAVYNSAKEGQTDSIGSVWGKNIIFAVCPDTPALMQVSLGYHVKNSADYVTYRTLESDPPGSEKIIVQNSYDDLISTPTAAYLIKNAIA